METDPLFDPKRYFADQRDYSLAIPLAAIAGVFVLAVATVLVEVLFVPTDLGDAGLSEQEAETVAAAAEILGVVFTIAWLLFVVAFYVLAFHLLTGLFDGDGPLKSTLAVVGWGFVPKLVHEFVTFLEAAWVAVQITAMDVPAADAGSGPVANLLVVVVALATLCWSAYIWYGGLQGARKVDSKGAAVAVGLPMLGALGIFLLAAAGRLLG